jgi:hypothetical protein
MHFESVIVTPFIGQESTSIMFLYSIMCNAAGLIGAAAVAGGEELTTEHR